MSKQASASVSRLTYKITNLKRTGTTDTLYVGKHLFYFLERLDAHRKLKKLNKKRRKIIKIIKFKIRTAGKDEKLMVMVVV